MSHKSRSNWNIKFCTKSDCRLRGYGIATEAGTTGKSVCDECTRYNKYEKILPKYEKILPPFIVKRTTEDNENLPDEVYRRFQLDDGKEVCENYDKELCNISDHCKGYPGYGCKSMPKNFYAGMSGYSVAEVVE